MESPILRSGAPQYTSSRLLNRGLSEDRPQDARGLIARSLRAQQFLHMTRSWMYASRQDHRGDSVERETWKCVLYEQKATRKVRTRNGSWAAPAVLMQVRV